MKELMATEHHEFKEAETLDKESKATRFIELESTIVKLEEENSSFKHEKECTAIEHNEFKES